MNLVKSTSLEFFAYVFLLILFLTPFDEVMGQCPSGDLTFENQLEIDNFPILYPNCTEIAGNLGIVGNNINDLSPLIQLTTVGGDLTVSGSDNLVNFSGLDNLNSLGGSLVVRGNDELIDFSGLENLTAIYGNFDVRENDELVNFTGLNNLEYSYGLLMYNNPLLQNMTGLESLTIIEDQFIVNANGITNFVGLDNLATINGYASIQNNSSLENFIGFNSIDTVYQFYINNNEHMTSLLGLETLTHARDFFSVRSCDDLTSTEGLRDLTYVGGILGFAYNFYLIDIEGLEGLEYAEGINVSVNLRLTSMNTFESLDSIGEFGLYIGSNDLSDLQFPNLQHVEGRFDVKEVSATSIGDFGSLNWIGGDATIEKNDVMRDIDGLSNVSFIGGDLKIKNNKALGTLYGLENVNSVGQNIEIYNNKSLSTLWGMENIYLDTLTSLTITHNLHLSICNVANVCAYMNAGNTYDIQFNDSGCEDATQIIDSCNGNYDCPTGNLTFLAQRQIEEYATHFPDCEDINGSLIIGLENVPGPYFPYNTPPTDVNDLSGLSPLTTINGSLHILDNELLENLTGLQNIHHVAEDLRIETNPILHDIQALENITSINQLTISDNDDLVDLNGLHNIDSIHVELLVEKNDTLPNLSDLNGLDWLTNVQIRENKLLNNLTGLEGIDTIRGNLIIFENDTLSTLNGLNNVLVIQNRLSIFGNSSLSDLSGLDTLNTIMGTCYIAQNDSLMYLEGLNNLEYVGDEFQISENPILLNLNGLNNLRHAADQFELRLSDSIVNMEGLENLDTVGYLDIRQNNNLVNLSGLDSIDFIGSIQISWNTSMVNLVGLENISTTESVLIQGNDSLQSVKGLENLHTLSGALQIRNNYKLPHIDELENIAHINGTITPIYISGNSSLNSIYGLRNVVTDIPHLNMTYNPLLEICSVPVICQHLLQGGFAYINDNATGCNSEIEILENCSDLTKILPDVFYDINQNGVRDSDEPDFLDASILVSPGDYIIFPNTSISNRFFVEPGSYTVSIDLANNPNWELTTDSVSYNVDVLEGECERVVYGLYPTTAHSELRPYAISPPTRCNEIVSFDVIAKNEGTTLADGILWFALDADIDSLQFINIPDTIISPNTYGWYFSDLQPSYLVEKQIAMQIPGPPEFSPGDLLFFDAYAEFNDTNGTHISSIFDYNPEVRCSYDPNDKLIHPSREGNYTLFDEDLIYTIRFQNTGNDVAYDVVIRDTLDANLDLETFRVLSSSHADILTTSMDDEGIVTFEFKEIFLPDSTSNFEGSQGYVSYLIRTLDGLAEETPVTNSAGIYFDFNPPIITNITENIMVTELPTVSTQSPANILTFSVVPNPNTGVFYVQGIEKGAYRIFNTVGQVIHSGWLGNSTAIDISEAASGIYFIEIREDGQIGTQRFIKQ